LLPNPKDASNVTLQVKNNSLRFF